jgi:hypothetical protein
MMILMMMKVILVLLILMMNNKFIFSGLFCYIYQHHSHCVLMTFSQASRDFAKIADDKHPNFIKFGKGTLALWHLPSKKHLEHVRSESRCDLVITLQNTTERIDHIGRRVHHLYFTLVYAHHSVLNGFSSISGLIITADGSQM